MFWNLCRDRRMFTVIGVDIVGRCIPSRLAILVLEGKNIENNPKPYKG